jgi:site-specific recombinase XerC
MRSSYLKRWQSQLNLLSLADLPGIFPRVEKALRAFAQDRTGKTAMNYAEALSAFCDWCVQRGYLEADPLKDLVAFDTEPQTILRAMPAEDIARLLEVSAPHKRLLYETAFISGLRATELRHLDRAKHLDGDRGGLNLEASRTKNRKPGFQPLPARLVD